jgi:hypothetical protein
MSTTVIGASLISALIAGSKAFRSNRIATSAKALSAPTVNMITEPGILERTVLELSSYDNLDLNALQQEAKSSARMCNCEGKQVISKTAIQVCSACGQTACASCAGNPEHVY